MRGRLTRRCRYIENLRVLHRPFSTPASFSFSRPACGARPRTVAEGKGGPLLGDTVRSEAADALVGRKHTERHVVVKQGEVIHHLLVERESARRPDELRLGKEPVVEPHSPS